MTVVPAVRVREFPPLRQSVLVTTPTGNTYRWGADEPKPENVPQGLSYSTVMPGGFEQMECSLPRKTGVGYQDMQRLSTITVLGAGGQILWEGRLEKTPRVSGDEVSISPQAVGWQAHLEDDPEAAEVYVDRDLSHWNGEPSRARQVALLASNFMPTGSATVTPDQTTGIPSLRLVIEGAWISPQFPIAETWYDAGAAASITSVYVDWSGDSATAFVLKWMSSTSADSPTETSADIYTSATGTNTYTGSAARRFWGWQWLYNASPAGNDGGQFYVDLRRLTVWGNHGLAKQGTAPADGLYASQVIANAVGRWAPALRVLPDSITSTSFSIPQLEFREPTTVAEIITQANRFGLDDWYVTNGARPDQPTFHLHPRNSYGKRWRARVAPAKLQETGPQAARLFNSAIVSYQDVDGTSKTVGPTGALTDATDASLLDTDSLNPLNQLGIRRPALLDMGIVSTVTAATEVGRQFLVRSKELDHSGQAELVGAVTDDHGVVFPSARVRAGDQISFTDSADPSYRRIVRTNYDHDSRTNSIDLDSPPEGMADLLERLSVSLAVGTSLPPHAEGAVMVG